jgi:hypothetical protein
VPCELSADHTTAITIAEDHAYVTPSMLRKELAWDDTRIDAVLSRLLAEGMAWVDDQFGAERAYWFPAFMTVSLETMEE